MLYKELSVSHAYRIHILFVVVSSMFPSHFPRLERDHFAWNQSLSAKAHGACPVFAHLT